MEAAAPVAFPAAFQPACDPLLLQAVERSLPALPPGAALGVALSAGADSATLALHAARVAADRGLILHCFHIHHGLQEQADDWMARAHGLATLLGASCHSRRVRVRATGLGMEAAARASRYEALVKLAGQAAVAHMLLAHHQDDQAETVLLRLLRGAGPLGLGAMAPVQSWGPLVCLRPWVDQPRARILASATRFAALSGWQPVHDPSNLDDRYARAAVRTRLAPLLDERWPAWCQVLARHARQVRELSDWVAETAQADWLTLEPAADGLSFSLRAWRALPPTHQAPVLRDWLRRLGVRMPTDARLQSWLRQLREVHALGHDRNVRLPHEGGCISVQRGRVLWIPKTQVE
jgi:tRNA(Ile)-lysidine synthase